MNEKTHTISCHTTTNCLKWTAVGKEKSNGSFFCEVLHNFYDDFQENWNNEYASILISSVGIKKNQQFWA